MTNTCPACGMEYARKQNLHYCAYGKCNSEIANHGVNLDPHLDISLLQEKRNKFNELIEMEMECCEEIRDTNAFKQFLSDLMTLNNF